MPRLTSALAVQGRVIWALMIRDIGSRKGGDTTGLYWILLEPIIVTLIVITVHVVSSGTTVVKSVPIVVFLLTGYVPHVLFRHSGLAGYSALSANGGLLYHKQIHFLDIIFARVFVEVITVLFGFTMVYLGFYLAGQIKLPYAVGYFFMGWFYQIWFVYGVCFLLTGAAFAWPIVRRMFQPMVLLFLPAYAAFFMLAWVSPNVRYYLLFFPPVNAAEMMRYGYFGNSALTFFDVQYTTEACLVLMFFGLLSAYRGRRRLEV